MIKALIPEQTFRLPASHLRRKYALMVAAAAAGAFVLIVSGKARPLDVAVLTALLLGPFLLVYPLVRLRVWVTLSGAGIQGRDLLGGRKTLVSWSEPVCIAEYIPHRGPPGVRVFRFNGRGGRSMFHSLFIPYPILRDSGFRAALARVAPGNHPLLTWQQ